MATTDEVLMMTPSHVTSGWHGHGDGFSTVAEKPQKYLRKNVHHSQRLHVTRRDQTVCVMMVVRYYHMQYILK